MIKDKVYISYFYNKKNLQPIDPIYLVHKQNNIKNATTAAKWYYFGYINQKKLSAMQKNKLYKELLVKTRKSKI